MTHRRKTRQELQNDASADEALAESFPARIAPFRKRDTGASARRDPGFMRPDELKWTAMEGGRPMKQEIEKAESSLVYLVGGFVAGLACGLLFAPKKGSELIADIGDWGRDTKERGEELYSKAKEYIPHRVKDKIEEYGS